MAGGAGGGPVLQGTRNHRQHTLDISEHIIVPESQHPVAAIFEESSSLLVFNSPHGMLPAVKFDYELGEASYEVADEGTDRDLAVEAGS